MVFVVLPFNAITNVKSSNKVELERCFALFAFYFFGGVPVSERCLLSPASSCDSTKMLRCCLPAAYIVTSGLAAEIISLSENALMRVEGRDGIYFVLFLCIESYLMNRMILIIISSQLSLVHTLLLF